MFYHSSEELDAVYLHSPIRRHGVMLSYSTGTTSTLPKAHNR